MSKLKLNPEGRFVYVGHERIHIVEQGEGEHVLLFIHGNSETALNWREVWSHLQGNFRCVAFDLPGHGFSERDWSQPHSLRYLCGIARGVMDALSIHRAIWVGHSLGGGICLSGATTYPERIQGIGLVASVGARIVRESIREGWSKMIPKRPRLWFRILIEYAPGSRFVDRVMDRTIRMVMHPQNVDLTLAEWQRDRHMWSRSTHIIAATEDLRCIVDSLDEIYPTYESIAVPCQIVSAIDDQVIPQEVARMLANRIPESELIEVSSAGHMLIRSHAKEVAEAVRALVKRVLSLQNTNTRATHDFNP